MPVQLKRKNAYKNNHTEAFIRAALSPIVWGAAWVTAEIKKLRNLAALAEREHKVAAHEDDFPNVGDVVPYDITTMSFLVVRTGEDEYKAYYNACLHRGRKLRETRAEVATLENEIAAKREAIERARTADAEAPLPLLLYLHGAGNLIPGVEKALAGSAAGAKVEATVSPEEGYGQRDDQLMIQVPRAELPEGDLQPGMQFQVQHEGGCFRIEHPTASAVVEMTSFSP